MKKSISLLLSLLMVISIITSVPLTASAASVSDLSFKLSSSGKSYYISSCKESAKGKIAIPNTYKGLPVTSIDGAAFSGCLNITSVVIPESIVEIGMGAFQNCTKLTSITISDSVKYIAQLAFTDTGYYNDSSNWKNNVLYVGNHLFQAKNSISGKYIIKDGTKTIADFAFYECTKLTSIIMPDSVVYIGDSAFSNCSKIVSIKLSNNIKSINIATFFACEKINSVTIPKGVTKIDEASFYRCKNLTSITIPNSVTNINAAAFSGCNKLSDVYFGGTAKKWNEINIVPNQNETLLNAKKHYLCKHKTTKWVTTKKATVNAAGSKYQKCAVCGVELKTAKIPQLKCAAPKLKAVTNVATGIKFTWNKVTGADNYEIYRKTGNGAWKKLATVKGTVTTYTDKTAKSGTTYKYTVKAKNEAGLSKYNTTGLTIKCLADPVLKAPTSTKNGITLKWNKVTGAQGYVVYRKAGNGKLVKLATVKGISKISYTDKSAKKGTKYTYQIKAYSGKTYSAYSNAKTIKDKY